MKRFALIVLAAGVLAACENNPAALAPDAGLASRGSGNLPAGELGKSIKEIRAATARYHSVRQALADGYVSTHECVSVPGLGGMGVHFVNPALLGDASFDPLRPEMLLYQPGPNGQMRLVGVEYMIFRAPWEAAGKAGVPMFGSQPFEASFGEAAHGMEDHYELHAWIWAENPSGMFAPFNPDLSCA